MARPMELISPTIESRMSIRIPVRLPITIELRPLLLRASFQAVTYNVSFDGALVEVSNSNPPKGAQVRVLLETAPKAHLIINASVVRSTDHSVALMFVEYSNEVFESLSAILAAGFNKYLDSRSGPRSEEIGEPLA